MEALDTRFNYLIVKMIYSADIDGMGDRSPAAIILLDNEFFEWVEARRDLALQAHDKGCVRLLFSFNIEYMDLDSFNPDSYFPDGEDDVADTEKMKATLVPIWEQLEGGGGFIVLSGEQLEELGLSEPEELKDFRTCNDYLAMRVDTVFESSLKKLGLILEAEEKHTYEPWNSEQIDFDDLKSKHVKISEGGPPYDAATATGMYDHD